MKRKSNIKLVFSTEDTKKYMWSFACEMYNFIERYFTKEEFRQIDWYSRNNTMYIKSDSNFLLEFCKKMQIKYHIDSILI